jgi:membrane associated rhomboid family serine protease
VVPVFRSRIEVRSVVVVLIIINVVIYLFTRFAGPSLTSMPRVAGEGRTTISIAVERYGLFFTLFSLFPVMIAKYGWVWQFVTYMFLHANGLHIFFNMYALFLFGRALEEKWGWKQFLAYYMVTGSGAGIVTFLWNLVQGSSIPTIGASGAIFGVLLAFGLEFPDVMLLFFFVVPIRARFAALIYGGLELVFLITGVMQRVGHFTHLAGLLFGYLYYLIGVRSGFGGGKPRGGRGRRSRASIPRFRREGLRPGAHRTGSARLGGESLSHRAAKDVDLTVALKEKIRSADPLSRADTAFLLKLKKAFDQRGGGVCEPAEFDSTAESCRSCEDFHACLYRFLIGLGSRSGNAP